MKRSLVPRASAIGCAFATAILAGVLFTGVPARADIDVRINIGNAPPAPHLVFRVRPHERFYPGEGVYVVDDPGVGDSDCFRYGGYYWVFRDGYWYRAPNWRGRFLVVHPRYVPAVFYRMPPTRWKHHPSGPPGHMNQGGPPGRMDQGRGGPPAHVDQGRGGPPAHMDQGRGGPPGPTNKGGPPGLTKKGGSGSQGPAKRGDKGDEKHGDRGGK
jgi:hypothetical protein